MPEPEPSRWATSALLALIDSSGQAVLTLTEGLSAQDLARSRLTRAEARRQLQALTDAAHALPEAVRSQMPEADWPAWDRLRATLADARSPVQDEALWFACSAMTPALLLWLQVYRKSHAGWFRVGG
jgi:uncharacterized protein with HEPN domain